MSTENFAELKSDYLKNVIAMDEIPAELVILFRPNSLEYCAKIRLDYGGRGK